MFNVKADNVLWKTAMNVIEKSLDENLPDKAVSEALKKIDLEDKNIYLLAIGKAAWNMAFAAYETLGSKIKEGIVITKYNHSKGKIGHFNIFEAGHPTLDKNTLIASEKAIDMAKKLDENDLLIFLISGGGSALFEKMDISLDKYQDINKALLKSGADIKKINCVRKHISSVKGGRFAKIVSPAKVKAIILSDVLGNRLDSIASGPVSPDKSTSAEALSILSDIGYEVDPNLKKIIEDETPDTIENSEAYIISSVEHLVDSASKILKANGYKVEVLSTCMEGEAVNMAKCFIEKSFNLLKDKKPGLYAFVGGGETTVTIDESYKGKYKAKGGRNQEMALAAAKFLSEENFKSCFFSIGSDGTDGPTDAAGGIVGNNTSEIMNTKHMDIDEYLKCHASYEALKELGGLIITGPTGTNVNDLSVLLVNKK